MLCTIINLLLLTIYVVKALPGKCSLWTRGPPIYCDHCSDDEYMNEHMQQRNIFQELIENRRRLHQVGI